MLTDADRQSLVTDNMKLAHWWAKRFIKSWPHVPYDDISQAAFMGIIEAARRFDASRGVKFSIYAAQWIRKEIMIAINQSYMIRVPRHYVDGGERAKMYLSRPGAKEIVSRSRSVHHAGDTLDTFALDSEQHENQEREAIQDKFDALNMREVLTEREQDILSRYYGLCGNQSNTATAIAKDYCVTQQRVSLIKMKAIRKLRDSLVKLSA